MPILNPSWMILTLLGIQPQLKTEDVPPAIFSATSPVTSLLRSMATYAAGPYIKDIIMKDTTCVSDVKREFMRFLEIELSDLTLLDFYKIQRKPNERPLRSTTDSATTKCNICSLGELWLMALH